MTRIGLEVAAGVLAADDDRAAATALGAAEGIRRRHGLMDDTRRERGSLERDVCDRLGIATYQVLSTTVPARRPTSA